jgi:hypothetical protein
MPPPDTAPTSAVYENRLYVTRALRPESLVLLLAASPPLRSPRRYRGGAAHGAAGRLCSRTIRTARSRTSGENLLGLPMTPSSQGMEPPGIPARFMRSIGSDLHMDYTAVGQTTHLAARGLFDHHRNQSHRTPPCHLRQDPMSRILVGFHRTLERVRRTRQTRTLRC